VTLEPIIEELAGNLNGQLGPLKLDRHNRLKPGFETEAADLRLDLRETPLPNEVGSEGSNGITGKDDGFLEAHGNSKKNLRKRRRNKPIINNNIHSVGKRQSATYSPQEIVNMKLARENVENTTRKTDFSPCYQQASKPSEPREIRRRNTTLQHQKDINNLSTNKDSVIRGCYNNTTRSRTQAEKLQSAKRLNLDLFFATLKTFELKSERR
jgi:hypothetical protein